MSTDTNDTFKSTCIYFDPQTHFVIVRTFLTSNLNFMFFYTQSNILFCLVISDQESVEPVYRRVSVTDRTT